MSSNPKRSESSEAHAIPVQTGETPIESAKHDESVRGRAYEISLARGGEPGHELDDWLQAEQELQTL